MSTPLPIFRQASEKNLEENLPIEVDATVWVAGEGNTASSPVWENGTVMAIGDLKVTVRIGGKVRQINRGLVLPLNPRITDDMTSLYYIHEAGVLHNLQQRSAEKNSEDGKPLRPYTFMANVLIAVNPLRAVTNPEMDQIVNNSNCSPHPYAVAEMAYTQMVYNSSNEMPTNQSVVVSGESGAGKTESSKIVLEHLTTRGVYGKSVKASQLAGAAGENARDDASLDRRLLEQNPILEAFGNAKTLRNHNSSRFGKFMKLQFSNDGEFKLAGAFVETYLLEKSRLVHQVGGERNFHIFYQLLAGASMAQIDSLKLLKPQDYRYLNQSGCYEAEETDDAVSFKEVSHGLTCVGISAKEQEEIFGIVSGMLIMGNMEFEDDVDATDGGSILSKKEACTVALAQAGAQLQVTPDYLFKVVTQSYIVTREETFVTHRNPQNSIYARDAISKSIYGRLFDWIIKRVNISLGQDSADLPFVGVLDIFGFESFQRNDFEQLLINFTNEVLQATFNDQVFIAEMELYKREGITVGKIEWPDNRECVELIASKPHGILQILDNEAKTPKPSDSKFLAMLHRTHSKNEYFPKPHAKDLHHMFIVKHFAGRVTYSIGAFIDKNNDTIPKDMADLFLSSQSSIMKQLFDQEATEQIAVAKATAGKSNYRPKKLKSVSAKFSQQMNELVATLDATRCNFIRCIKPNAMMKQGFFDPRYVVGQLRCQGIMQTAQVLKVGLPTRVSYAELVRAYKPHMPADAQKLFAHQSDGTLISAILWAFKVPQEEFKLGLTKLFFKAGKIATLDAILKINWHVEGPAIVARMKLWLARRRWRVALTKVKAQNRFMLLLRKMQFRKNAVSRLQQWWRTMSARQKFLKIKWAAIKVQALQRGRVARMAFRALKVKVREAANARAKEAARQAEEAQAKVAAAEAAAEVARQERAAREAADEAADADRLQMETDRLQMEAEAKAAEEEARELGRLAAEAVAEADAANEAVNAAVLAEKQASARALAESEALDARMATERAAAETRKQEALASAAALSVSVLGGLGASTRHTDNNGQVVQVVDVPDGMSQENQEQLTQLNDLLLSGAISQSEYEELVPFLMEAGGSGESAAAAHTLSATQQEGLDRLLADTQYGIQIRCPVCGENNNTANGSTCSSCRSSLTADDHSTNREHQYYSSREQSIRNMNSSAADMISAPKFKIDGQRVQVHGGFFQCQMHGTQILADENFAEYTVYVLRCGWQAEDGDPNYWMVAHRFSVFERLHKDLKLKIPSHIATLPVFPKKHVMSGLFAGKTGNSGQVVSERKKGLALYIQQVIDMMATLPDSLAVPELDRFLNLSQSVSQLKTTAETPLNHAAEGAEGLAAREDARTEAELPAPLDDVEMTQFEQALAMFDNQIRTASGDLRRNAQLQRVLKICVKLQPRLEMSASIDNPFADVDLIPRAMQSQEDLQATMGLYNDALLAMTQS